MGTFSYQALDRGGKKTHGELEARSRSDVFRRLEEQGLQAVSIEQKEVSVKLLPETKTKKKVEPLGGDVLLNRAQIILFTEELSDLLQAGLQLEPALAAMERRSELGGLKQVVTTLREKVKEGISFSTALKSVSTSFGELYCNLVSAGEISGSLPSILMRQATYLKTLDELRNRVIQSLIYPCFIIAAGIVLMVVFMTQLVPQLTRLLKETGKKMPFLTQLLIDLSDFVGQYGFFIIAFLLILGMAIWWYLQKPEGQLWWHEKQLRMPLIGGVVSARYYAQFSQTLANLVGNGIPLLNALKLMQPATPNLFFRRLLLKVVDVVAEGGSFSRALRGVGHFPPLFIDMVSVGEQTGDIAAAMEKVALRYDRDLTIKIQRLTALIQPTIIVIMALIVGLVAYAMISGIFQTISGLKVR
jgi:general secretion pathway protein F